MRCGEQSDGDVQQLTGSRASKQLSIEGGSEHSAVLETTHRELPASPERLFTD